MQTKNSNKISIIMPVFNERDTISKTIKRVADTRCFGENKEIIVIDDGSNDGTGEILENLKKEIDFILIAHSENRGKGAAVKSGIEKTRGNIILIQDADLEYNPDDYENILRILDSAHPVVYGSRNLERIHRGYLFYFLGAKFLTGLFNMLHHSKLTDVYTCYKAFQSNVIKDMDIESNGFEFEVEITAKIFQKNITISEVPINYNPRTFRMGKKIRLKDGMIGIWTIFKYLN